MLLCAAIAGACIERGSKHAKEGRDIRAAATPAAPTDTSEQILSTTVGDDHACAVSSLGAAYCWGPAASILGADDTTSGVVRVAGGHRFAAIAAGASFTCAIDREGQAFCWGGAQRGQLGAGAFFDFSTEPQLVAGGHRFTSITAGTAHVCGVDDSGAAWCWGDNGDGQLGDTSVRYASHPVRVSGGHVFKQLGAGAESQTTCGVTTDGAAFCWGLNGKGPLAHGTANPSAVPVRVPRLSRLIAIDPGSDVACALDSRGDVYCWGSNALGQLGLGYPVRDTLIPAPTQRVSGGQKFVSLSVGDGRACAVARAGTTYCWGSADEQLLGATPDDRCTDRQISCARSPSLVRDATLTQVALGPHDRICGAGMFATTAPVYCWGRDFAQPSQIVLQAKAVAIWQTVSVGTQSGR